MNDHDNDVAAATDEACRYCNTKGEDGPGCASPWLAINCPHMDTISHADLRRALFGNDDDEG